MALHTIYYLERSRTLFNRTNIIYYDNLCVTKIKYILCIVLKLIALIIITLFAQLCGRVGILNTCGKHDHIISIRGDAWVHQSSLTRPLSNEVPVPSEESERSCICVLGVSIITLSTILIIDFEFIPTVWYFLCFSFYLNQYQITQ